MLWPVSSEERIVYFPSDSTRPPRSASTSRLRMGKTPAPGSMRFRSDECAPRYLIFSRDDADGQQRRYRTIGPAVVVNVRVERRRGLERGSDWLALDRPLIGVDEASHRFRVTPVG